MVTLDIYLLLGIIGIATISLYVNIFVAVKVRNRFVYTDELEKADDAIEDLHIQNMALIEEISALKNRLKLS